MNKKNIYIFITKIFLSLVMALNISNNPLYSDCDYIVMIAEEGKSIADLVENNNSDDFDNPEVMFSYFKNRSTQNRNNDGYGIFCYLDSSQDLSESQKFIQTGFDTSIETDPNRFKEAELFVLDDDNAVSIVLAHARKTSQGAYGSHPFKFTSSNSEMNSSNNNNNNNSNKITYSFQHNGDCTPLRENMFNYLNNRDVNWFEKHPSNWADNSLDYRQWIDSELLFQFIMSFVIDNDGDILRGMEAALTYNGEYGDFYKSFHGYFNTFRVNITLSDGKDVYIFRNTRLNGSSFNLSYKKYNNGLLSIKTQTTIPGGNRIAPFSLTKFSRNGEIHTIPNIYRSENNYQLSIVNYHLEQNYPNPFNPVAKINYRLPVKTMHASSLQSAEIVVFNIVGQQVWSSPITDHSSPITNYCTFDGSKFNSGVYYYSLVVDGQKMITKKMVLTK